ncbi:MAG: alpha-ketoglutarate-dependent dioxygenase AlkB [Bacteroidota bacterium]
MNLFTNQENPEFVNFPVENGEVLLMENFLSPSEAILLIQKLKTSIEWRQESIKMYGKVYPIPRQTAWYGEDGRNYAYSGIMCNPSPWTHELLELKNRIEALLPLDQFNSVLLNRYRNGNDKVSWHSDDEKELGINPTIASISLGATRRFDLRHKTDKSKTFKLNLSSGSLLIMKGELQHFWEHQVPQQKLIVDERINLTFRRIHA